MPGLMTFGLMASLPAAHLGEAGEWVQRQVPGGQASRAGWRAGRGRRRRPRGRGRGPRRRGPGTGRPGGSWDARARGGRTRRWRPSGRATAAANHQASIAATANRAMLRKRRVISGSGNEGRRHGGVVTASLGRDRGTPQGGRSPRSGNAPRPPEPKPRAPADSAGQDMGLSPLGASIWSADDHGYEPEPREPPTVPGPHACAAGPGDSSRNGAVRAGGRRVDRPRPAGARTGTWREMALGSADSRQLRRADRLLSLGQETPA